MCSLFTSCNKQEKGKSETFYYDVYSSNKKITAYYRIISTYEKNVRVDSVTRFNMNGDKTDERIERYLVTKDTLYKINLKKKYPYLINNLEECTQIDRAEKIETCLLENETYLIFTEQALITDGIKRKLTFDKNFNLIENEYVDGYLNYYKISKRDNKPTVLIDLE